MPVCPIPSTSEPSKNILLPVKNLAYDKNWTFVAQLPSLQQSDRIPTPGPSRSLSKRLGGSSVSPPTSVQTCSNRKLNSNPVDILYMLL